VVEKPEAGVKPEPDSSVVFALKLSENEDKVQAHAYDKVINGKVAKTKGQNPKFTFESKELFDQA
jgi:hypothetical protein